MNKVKLKVIFKDRNELFEFELNEKNLNYLIEMLSEAEFGKQGSFCIEAGRRLIKFDWSEVKAVELSTHIE